MHDDIDPQLAALQAAALRVEAKDRKWLRWATDGAAVFSTCAKAQYLAVIVDARGRVVSTGYNGSPPGFGHCNEGACPRMAEGSASGSSYDNCLAVHAEANALVHGDAARFAGATLYVNGMPCFGCAKMIAGAGIARVVYTDGSVYPGTEDLFAQAGIVLVGLDLEGSTNGTK